MQRIGPLLGRGPGRVPSEADGAPPLREELFGLLQLARHGRMLAEAHRTRGGRGRELLLARLRDNERVIRESYACVVDTVQRKRTVAPAAEWLLDNYYLIEEQIAMSRRHLPGSYSRELPRVVAGPSAGLPRVYDLILELVSHTDGRVDVENLSRFVEAYQQVKLLRLGELWAVPIMLRLTLTENLRRVVYRIAWGRRQRNAAFEWAERFKTAAHTSSKALITELAEFVQAQPRLSEPFVAELAGALEGGAPALSLVINWIEHDLSEKGQTIELVRQSESHAQAIDQISIGNCITSLRTLSAIDWKHFVETQSVTEKRLRRDPAEVYAGMDFSTRDRYRHVVERLARRGRLEEEAVAGCVVALAAESDVGAAGDPLVSHIGYYLMGAGRPQFERALGVPPPCHLRLCRRLRRVALPLYLSAGLVVSLLMALPFAAWTAYLPGLHPVVTGSLVAVLWLALTQPAMTLLNWFVTLFVPPRPLPRLDFAEGIPPPHSTAVVVPALLTSLVGVRELLEQQELRYLANRGPNLVFVLLSDFADAAAETQPADAELLAAAVDGTRVLNAKYAADGAPRFHLLHRPRRWNPQEGCWMGWERKRGKLEQFSELVLKGAREPFQTVEGDVGALRTTRYVIVLDSDTQLPAEAAWKLVGTLAHPLNQPRVDAAARRVVSGYALLQPRLMGSLHGAARSAYARMFAGDVGIDPYTREVSNVYYDLFGTSQFSGKGIYDVAAFYAVTGGRFPENRILSHDLLEACHARCGFVGDVDLIEDAPARFLVDAGRQHRWIRGDWQIARWLLPRVPLPDAGPGGAPAAPEARGWARNPVGAQGRWMIFDNLRRSLVPLALLTALAMTWPLAARGVAIGNWVIGLLAMWYVPALARGFRNLVVKPRECPWGAHAADTLEREWRQFRAETLLLVCLPFHATRAADAIARVAWRLSVSHRHLLRWQTTADAERGLSGAFSRTLAGLWVAPATGLAWLVASQLMPHGGDPMGDLLAGMWLVSPVVVWLLSQPRRRSHQQLTAEDARVLACVARRTWLFFEHFVGPEHNWLPPDNYQEIPEPRVANRTSPTNIGLALLANLAAWDLGYAPGGVLLERTRLALTTLEKLERHRRHFYNWYDTYTLRPLHPLYISSVDSGNLCGALVVLREGLRELIEAPAIPARWREGLEDTLAVLREELADVPNRAETSALRAALDQLAAQVHAPAPDAPAGIRQTLGRWRVALEAFAATDDAPGRWLAALQRQLAALHDDATHLFPASDVASTSGMPALRALARGPAARGARAEADVQLAEPAVARIELIEELMARCDDLNAPELDFLYDRSRHLLSIGYSLTQHRPDPGAYDLLASEARLASFMGVAWGQLPVEHWFHLGRLMVTGATRDVLVSWSGSLFEYLMPLLLMPGYEGSLLTESCTEAVRCHIRHGRHHAVPWGVSESGYNLMDSQRNYQYRAFGTPDLGLKRGLVDDLVIAPYATTLALLVLPRPAAANLRRLLAMGARGCFGLYEAIDYTPSRVPADDSFVILRSYMAHHSGMSLLALSGVLRGNPMVARFLADPEMHAMNLLLQERVPAATGARSPVHATTEGDARRLRDEERGDLSRSYHTAHTAHPEVHLLSNGRLMTMVTAAGSGFTRLEGLALTRWREDPTRDDHGAYVYLRDATDGRTWATTAQPMHTPFDRYEATFGQGLAEYRSVYHAIETFTRIAVSPEHDVELRRITLTNLSDGARDLELTSFCQLALFDARADADHPAFQNLFVETEWEPARGAVLARRRPRAPDERWPIFFNFMIVREGLGGPVSCETRRAAFLGRLGTVAAPAAMQQLGPLANASGAVLDPGSALRSRVVLAAGQSVTVDLFLGAATDRDEAIARVDHYNDPRLADRLFDLAWTHSQVQLHELRGSEADAQLFCQLAGCMLYAHPTLRGSASSVTRNRKGQSNLWSHGISGDLPIVLLRVSDLANLKLVRVMIQAHAYWREKGLAADLVIWTEAFAGYRQSLLGAVVDLVHTSHGAHVLNQPGGISVRAIDDIPDEDRTLFVAVARLVVNDRHGPLREQVARRFRFEAARRPLVPGRFATTVPREEQELAPRELVCPSVFGGFTPDGREYVINLRAGQTTPAPWVNVLANAEFGTVVSEAGGGYTWYRNAHEFRLTPWSNDPVGDPTGEAVYIRDEESGEFHSLMPLPAPGATPYVCRHGLGYTAFEHTERRVFTECLVYVAVDAPMKFMKIRVRNVSGRTRRLSLTAYAEWVLGDHRAKYAPHTVTRIDPQSGAILAWNAFNTDFAGHVGIFHCSQANRELTADRTEFIGRNGALADPAGLHEARLSNRVGACLDPCAAMRTVIEVPPDQERDVVFMLGAARDEQEARRLLGRFNGIDGARQALGAVWDFWKHHLGGFYVETPDASVNVLANHWLLYQVLAARFWGRTGFYQSGGAFGFRDQLQDGLALLYDCPWLTRQHLLLCASRQFERGDVQHWWHPPNGRGVRTHIADDFLWLPYVAAHYVETTGDRGVLDELAPFLTGREPGEQEESCYDLPHATEKMASLFEHCARAIRHGLSVGAHGLPLMGGGDWNDGLNAVGHEGRGESVWLAFFLCEVLRLFEPLARQRGDADLADTCRQAAGELQCSIEQHAWDGDWYLRAFYDDGSALGSATDAECQIDSITQSWAALSGVGAAERVQRALAAVETRLVDRDHRLIRLLTPPFDQDERNPGYIRGYLPGVRENGAQYTHAAIWYIMAVARRGDARAAWDLVELINPVRRGDTAEQTERYAVEPYVLAADVYTVARHEGRGGWTWYTGSAGWLYQLLVRDLLGLRIRADWLTLNPLPHPDWPAFAVHYRFRGVFYHIKVVRVKRAEDPRRRVYLDGVEVPDGWIHMEDGQGDQDVRVELPEASA